MDTIPWKQNYDGKWIKVSISWSVELEHDMQVRWDIWGNMCIVAVLWPSRVTTAIQSNLTVTV